MKRSKCSLSCTLPGQQTILFGSGKSHLLKWQFIKHCGLQDQLIEPLTECFKIYVKTKFRDLNTLLQKVQEQTSFHCFALKQVINDPLGVEALAGQQETCYPWLESPGVMFNIWTGSLLPTLTSHSHTLCLHPCINCCYYCLLQPINSTLRIEPMCHQQLNWAPVEAERAALLAVASHRTASAVTSPHLSPPPPRAEGLGCFALSSLFALWVVYLLIS